MLSSGGGGEVVGKADCCCGGKFRLLKSDNSEIFAAVPATRVDTFAEAAVASAMEIVLLCLRTGNDGGETAVSRMSSGGHPFENCAAV